MKKKTLYILIGIVVALLIALVYGKKQGWFGKKEHGKKVETAFAKRVDILEKVTATGKIQPEVEVKLSSEVSGEIIKLPIKEGQEVKKGDLLVMVNPDIYKSTLNRAVAGLQSTKANYNQAQARLEEAKANYNRTKTLFDKGIISQAEWDKTNSSYKIALASVESSRYTVQSTAASVSEARDNLGRTSIFAPMSGTVSKLNVELGERVVGTKQMAGTEIVRVANLNNMEVVVDVNENDIIKVSLRDTTIVEVDAYPKKKFKGIVTEIANSSKSQGGADQVTNFEVKVRILESSYKDLLEGRPKSYSPFRPGMTASVDIITNRKNNVLAVPISAVVMKNDTIAKKRKYGKKRNKKKGGNSKKAAKKKADELFECVFVADGKKAKLKKIETGIQDDTYIEILNGLDEETKIIIGPYNIVTKRLKAGDAISLKKEEKEEKETEE